MEVVFWVAVFLLVYPYVLYPVMLWAGARLFPRPSAAGTAADDAALPALTVIVSAHNEAAVIEEKIRTTLACDYPAERLGILVVSDASTDETNAIVEGMAERDPRVRLLAIAEHHGKTAGLNRAMESIDTDIVVFTDANAVFAGDALRRLAACFADPAVGYAVGAALYRQEGGSTAGENEGLYWRYELALKKLESDFDSVVGGDGAIYAVRRDLYRTLAPEDINDFVNPLQVIGAGYRGVFVPEARAYEEPANDYGKEFRRKRRIVCRSWGALLRYYRGLALTRRRRFLFMLVSHKVIRWFTLAWLGIAAVANLLLVMEAEGAIYLFTLLGFLGVFGLAAVGRGKARRGEAVPAHQSIPYFFLSSNLAALLGIIDYARGNRYVTWTHVRQG